MTISVKMNRWFRFIVRRKWVIITVTILFMFGFLFVNNLMAKDKQAEPEKVPIEAVQQDYFSDFTVFIENKYNGQLITNVGTIKKSLLTDDVYAELEEAKVNLEKIDMNVALIIYSRGSSGEAQYIRVKNNDQKTVNTVANILYNYMVKGKSNFYKGKIVTTITPPSLASRDTPQYTDYYNYSDPSIVQTNAQGVTEEKGKNPVFLATFGAIIGFIFSIFVALFIDIKDKKIHSISYIATLFATPVKVIDATGKNEAKIDNILDIFLKKAQSKLLIYQEPGETLLTRWVSIHPQVAELRLEKQVMAESINFSEYAVLGIKQHVTSIPWLVEQYDLLVGTGKEIIFVFMDDSKK